MNDREKLIDLIIDAKRRDPETGSFTEFLADHLIANGVTVDDDNDFHVRWIPVSERLPEDCALSIVTYIRCDNGKPASDGIAYRDRGCWYWRFDSPENDEVVLVEITHWMPLPQPQKGE